MYGKRGYYLIRSAPTRVHTMHVFVKSGLFEINLLLKNRVEMERRPGLPDLSWCTIPKPEEMYQMNTKYTKWS
jgi:hypothetical protein